MYLSPLYSSWMKLQQSLFVVLGVLAPAFAGSPVLPAPAVRDYIVQLRPDADPGVSLSPVMARAAVAPRFVYRHAIQGFAAPLSAPQIRALQTDPRVLLIEPDAPIALPPFEAERVFLSTPDHPAPSRRSSQRVPTGVLRSGIARSPTARIDGRDTRLDVDIAVIDTGIDHRHPDLRIAGGFTLFPNIKDGNGHGTHVAGIIAARDNGFGVVGMAPGARLWAVKVLDGKGRGSWGNVIMGLDWVASRSATIEVVNLSIGGALANDGAVKNSIDGVLARGIVVTAAAGNDSHDVDQMVPARFDGVVAVSALADSNGQAGRSAGIFRVGKRYREQDESFADFSNFGQKVALAAPGVRILSTYKNRGYARISGTSQAAPHAAGAAALWKLTHPTATPAEVRAALIAAASPFAPGDDNDGIHEPALNVSGF